MVARLSLAINWRPQTKLGKEKNIIGMLTNGSSDATPLILDKLLSFVALIEYC
jgi:hypothetical protein